jgi:hypothetical protein
MLPGDKLLVDDILARFMPPVATAINNLKQMILDGYIVFRGELPDLDPDEYFASMRALRDWARDRANTLEWNGDDHQLLHVAPIAKPKPNREPVGAVGLALHLKRD